MREVAYSVLNTAKSVGSMNKQSNVGLVIDWGFHKMDGWTVAQSPFLVEALITEFEPVILPSQRAYEKHEQMLDYVLSFEPGWSAPKIDYNNRSDHAIGIITSDPHNKTDWFADYIRDNDIEYIFSPYYHPFLAHFPDISEDRIVHLPWAVPERFMIDPDDIVYRGQEKIHIFGATGSDIYEVRDWCREFPFVINHTNSGAQNKVMDHEEYYKWCQKFDATIAAGTTIGRLKYVFAKYFEIPAAGSLLFAQENPDLPLLGLSSDNCILFTKDNFPEKVDNYHDDPEQYLERRRRGCELMHERHTINDRVNKIHRCLFESNE